MTSAGAMSALLLLGQTAPLLANPSGGTVVAGGATIGSAGLTLNINQSTQNAIINWQSFSIANGETTKFVVPNSGATLNRVTGGNLSSIYGSLQSNGTVYLVNPNGVVVGPSGQINTAGFLASTLDVSNEDFLGGGDMHFTGGSTAAIKNAGVIHAATGDVYLIADQVKNSGTISAAQGNVGLAAGNDVLFQQAGNQHLFVTATPTTAKRATGVTNSGTINAAAAELKAAGGNAYALAINNSGVIAATGYKKINGQVYLTSDGGSIKNSGKISAKQANGNGGTIALTGTSTTSTRTANKVTNTGTLDVSSAVAGGAGGSVTIKNMTGATDFGGTLAAKGGQGGAGGKAEVSGYTLGFTGNVDLTAPCGKTGDLLLDPVTLTVVSGVAGAVVGGQNDPNQSTIGNFEVDNALATADLTLNADTSITISAAILWTGTTTLTLSTNTAGSTININAGIGGTGTNFVIDTKGATDVISCPGIVEVNNFTLMNGAWVQDASVAQNGLLPIFSVSNNFALQGGSFLRSSSGTGSVGNPYLISDVYGLQGIASASLLTDSFQLANDIDATGTVAWNTGAGFTPIGFYDGSDSSDANTYSGVFNGAGFIVNGLTVNGSRNEGSGLFGDTASASVIENLGLTNVNIFGAQYTGGLGGVVNSTVHNVYVTGSVTGTSIVGGLMGISSGTISNSYSIASVSGSSDVGGLDGFQQFGMINDCYSSGSVSGSGGGLVGTTQTGTVTNSFWDTSTSGQSTSVGGTGDTTTTLLMASTYSGAGWSIGTDLSTDTWVILDGATRPMLAQEYSSEITNAHQLQLVGLNSTTQAASYILANNIDLSGTSNAADVWGTSTTNGGLGWSPIAFSGTLNGRSNTIDGMYINLPTTNSNNVGLIGQLSTAGVVENLGLTNLQIHVGQNGSAPALIGGLAGFTDSSSSIQDVYTTGTITVTGPTSGGVGGLVGQNTADVDSTYSTVAITVPTGSGSGVGGLIGNNFGAVTNSYAAGTVDGAATQGGLVGENLSGGTIANSYSVEILSGTGFQQGGLVGFNTGTISNSFWDTDTAGSGVVSGVGSDISPNTTPGVLGATTAQLESQTFILANSPDTPTWDFSNIWTTNSDTTTPQLIALPQTQLPTGGSSGTTYTLSGTAFSDSGLTPDAAGLTIDFIFGGGLLGSTTTDSSGDFIFTLNSASNLTGGLLLTDTSASGGNTYYQSNTAASASGINILGGTLSIFADSASNSALKTAVGSLSTSANHILYTVNNTNALSTSSGVGIQILSGYTLDGNITASGSFFAESSSSLGSSQNVTITAANASISGEVASTGSLTVTTTSGDLLLGGIVDPDISAAGLTLNSAGSVEIENEAISLTSGNFIATGTGSSNDLNGIDVVTSTINSNGGNISLTGQAGIANVPQIGEEAGSGVSILSSTLETAPGANTPATGNITIQGTGSIGTATVTNSLAGVTIGDSSVSVVNGTLGITGTVVSGTSATFGNGVFIYSDDNAAASIAATGSGSIAISGTAAGSTTATYNDGVNLSFVNVSAVNGAAGINITGTGGNFADTTSSSAANASGISVFNGSTVAATGSAPITLVGTGGVDTTGDVNGYAGGILLSSGSSGVVSSITGTTGAISLAGTSGVSPNFTFGINLVGVDAGSAAISTTSGDIALNGSMSTSANPSSFPQAVVIQTGALVTTASGSITIAGTVAGTVAEANSASQATGVIARGGAVIDATGSGSVSIIGETTGALASGSNFGVQLDDSQVSTAAGSLTITGGVADVTGSTNAQGVFITDNAAVSVVNAPLTITGTVSGGTSASGGFVEGVQLLNGNATATGTGSVSITGDSSGSTGSQENVGLYMSGVTVSAENASGLSVSGVNITGTAGNIANVIQNAGAIGLYIYQATTISATGSAPITLVGTGGTDPNTVGSLNTFSEGIFDSSQVSGVANSISSTTGAISITGTGGVSPSLSVGVNLYAPNGGVASVSSTSGAININGTVTSAANPSVGLYGTFLEVGSTVTTQSGAISITGALPFGSATVGTQAQADGLAIEQSTISVTGTGSGSISLTGNATGVTGDYQLGGILMIGTDVSASTGNITLDGTESSNSSVSDELFGVVIRSLNGQASSPSAIVAQNGSVSLTGTVSAGTAGQRAFGVRVNEGSTVTAEGANGNVTINGSTVGSTSDGVTTGVVVEGSGSSVSAAGTGGLIVTGNAGALAGTAGAVIDPSGDNVSYNPLTDGILVSEGSSLTTSGTAPMSLTGTGGSNTNTDTTSSSAGFAIFSPLTSTLTSLSAGGALSITGPALMIGVPPNNMGSVSITASAGTTLNSQGAGLSTVDASISGALSLNGSDFAVDFVNSPTFGTIAVNTLTINATGLAVNLGTTNALSLTINNAGDVGETMSGSLTTSLLTIGSATSVELATSSSNAIGALGDITSSGVIDVTTDTDLTLTGAIVGSGAITLATTNPSPSPSSIGNITLGAQAQITENGEAAIVLAAGEDLAHSHYIMNDSVFGVNAIEPADGGAFYLYSSDPTYDNLGGLSQAIPASNMFFGAVYPIMPSVGGNLSLFYAAAGAVGPNPPLPPGNTNEPPSTATGGAAGAGPNLLPPVLTPTISQIFPVPDPKGSFYGNSGNDLPPPQPPPPFSFTGNGMSQVLGQLDGGLANSASNSGFITSGDIAQLDGGEFNNVTNPQASDLLDAALGPIVYENLADALRAIGDWADVPEQAHDTAATNNDETILTGGDVAEMSSSSVKNIPLSQAPEQLRNAMSGDVLKGVSPGH